MSRDCILARIDAALEKMRFQAMEVRLIYLTDKSYAAFHRAMRRKVGRRTGYFFSYQDHQIVSGQRDVIYSKQGVGTTIPKRLSPRVEDLAA